MNHTISEHENFYRDARRVLDQAELDAVILYIAYNPMAGTLLPNSDGCRYIRCGAKGHGKGRGGRVVYYYGGDDMPILLVDIFFKGHRDRITASDHARYRKIVEAHRNYYNG